METETEQAEQVTEPLNLVYPTQAEPITENIVYCYQAEQNIKVVLNKAERLTEQDDKIFCGSLKFLVENSRAGKPSIKRIWTISELGHSNKNKQKVKNLFLRLGDKIQICEGLQIKSEWALLSNNQLIRTKRGYFPRYINAVN